MFLYITQTDKIMTPLKSDKVCIYNVLPKITKNVQRQMLHTTAYKLKQNYKNVQLIHKKTGKRNE